MAAHLSHTWNEKHTLD